MFFYFLRNAKEFIYLNIREAEVGKILAWYVNKKEMARFIKVAH